MLSNLRFSSPIAGLRLFGIFGLSSAGSRAGIEAGLTWRPIPPLAFDIPEVTVDSAEPMRKQLTARATSGHSTDAITARDSRSSSPVKYRAGTVQFQVPVSSLHSYSVARPWFLVVLDGNPAQVDDLDSVWPRGPNRKRAIQMRCDLVHAKETMLI